MELITIEEAKERGLTRFFTGVPCKHGHIAERHVSGGKNCVVCHRKYNKTTINTLSYYKKYQQCNKNKINKAQQLYRQTIKGKQVRLLSTIKVRARKLGLDFDLTIEDVSIPTHCPILGIPLILDNSNRECLPSVDRIDNTKGYIKGNVCVISMRANRLKSDSSIAELEAILQYMKGN